MIDPGHKLSISRQAKILEISRSSVYYTPRPVSPADLELMKAIDRLHLEAPYAGSRMRKKLLRAEGFKVGRRHVRTLMRTMGVEALYRKKNTSRRHPGHKVFPYLLRGRTITEANQAWALDITYIPMARGFVYFVGVMDWATRRILSWRLSTTLTTDFCVEALEDAISRYGKPEVVNTDQSLPPRKRGAASSRVRRSSSSCTATESLSAWTARVLGRTTSSSSDFGGR